MHISNIEQTFYVIKYSSQTDITNIGHTFHVIQYSSNTYFSQSGIRNIGCTSTKVDRHHARVLQRHDVDIWNAYVKVITTLNEVIKTTIGIRNIGCTSTKVDRHHAHGLPCHDVDIITGTWQQPEHVGTELMESGILNDFADIVQPKEIINKH